MELDMSLGRQTRYAFRTIVGIVLGIFHLNIKNIGEEWRQDEC
jgi:hypothetical protein